MPNHPTKRRMVANRVTEKDIRDWLDQENFVGASAQFTELELHAIRHPGWEQVFRFTVTARQRETDIRQQLFGVFRGDERATKQDDQSEIQVFQTPQQQRILLTDWCQGMYVCRTGQTGKLIWTVLVLFLFLVVAITLSNLLN